MSTSDEGELIAGRYRLSSELGRGAMGVVWLARDERLGRTVAVKELRGGVGLSSTQLEQSNLRARREARIAARLHHPNAVAVFDVAEHAGRPYLVMEYVRARTLSETLAEESYLDPVRAAEIGVQLASALAAAHEAGIVHRDVKPGNILLGEDGKAKLTDFGISRAVGDATVTGTGEMLGTPAYVAPEVAQGRAATASSDVFSLGATLYAAVEGEPPFGTGPAVMALLLRIVNGEMRPPLRSGLLTDALLRMMHNDPMSRPSMDAARYELQSVAGSALSLPKQSPTTLPSAPATSMRMRARTPEPGQPPAPAPDPSPKSAASLADRPPPGRQTPGRQTQASDTRVDAATPA
ncbi:serine/threonine protein kinase, partial [Actinospica durhamensis]